MRPKIVGVIQARMGSSRLPGKVLSDLCGEPALVRMIERVRRCRLLDEVWIATTTDPTDDAIADVVQAHGAKCFRGSAQDVLDRFYRCAQDAQAQIIVRLTADCPLHDPSVIDETIRAMLTVSRHFVYAYNNLEPTYPDGLDVEVFTFEALEQAARTCQHPLEREHVRLAITKEHLPDTGQRPAILTVPAPADFSHLRFVLDEPEDLDFIRRVYAALYPQIPQFTWLDVVALLTRCPWMVAINAGFNANAGVDGVEFQRSIELEPGEHP